MLGPVKSRRLDQPIAVSLEDLIPAENVYRHLETKLDLSFAREWSRKLYAERGRPSIDPLVFFKLQLIMFFEGIRSECLLIETARLNIAHHYSLGYAPDEALTKRSSVAHIANTMAPSAADPLALSLSRSAATSSLHRGDRTRFPSNRRM
jgi:transposase